MATVYVTEYTGTGAQNGCPMPIANTPAVVASNNVAIGETSAQSAAFNVNTRMIRINTDLVCSIEIGGLNPTATTSSARFAANQTEYFWVNPGHKLAVIANS